MSLSSGLRGLGATVPVTSRSISGYNNTAVDATHTRLVWQENLRLQERVMQLEAQMELIANTMYTWNASIDHGHDWT